jgi:hypothetical protein
MKAWTIGLLLSLLGGAVASWAFLKGVRRWLGVPPKPRLSSGNREVPPWLTGVVERLFFTFLVAFDQAGAPTAMVAWLAVKLATNWNHPAWKENPDVRTFAFSALLGGLVSMLFAFLGGLVCRRVIFFS